MLRRFARIPPPLRRVLVLLGVVAAVAGLPGPAMAAVAQATPASPAVTAVVAGPAHELAGTRAAHATGPATSSRPAAPGGVCQVPGVGDIGGLLGFCAAGSSGIIGDLNNICQPSVPAPEPATGGIDALIRPPAGTAAAPGTLYDRYGLAGQSWAAYGLQCSDMTSLIGNNIAAVVFDAAKALDRVTITVYQSAAGEGILAWLSGAVDKLITSLGNAIYFPYLAPVVIIGAIWLAWQGLIRRRATRTIEGTVWMVLACVAAIWLIGRPADFTGMGKAVSDGITQTLNVAFAKLPAPQQSSCVPLQKGDPQLPAGGSFAYAAGNGVVDANANELWTVLVCKPWLDGEFGTTSYGARGGPQTVVDRYGRQLLWAQAIATNERPTAAVISAKQDAYAGIAASIKNNYPAVYPLFQGKQWTTRLEIAFAALFAALAAGLLVLLIAITLIILKLGFLLLLVAGPFFLIIGTHPGFGRIIALRWAEMLIGVLLKTAAIALVLSVLLYAYSLIMGASDAVLPWALKILMISLVTVAVFIYRKPFGHLFSAVGYGMIGSRERAEESLARAGSTAGRNTADAATVAVPGFGAYRAARWARRNPAQAAGLAAQVAAGGAAGAAAGAAMTGADGAAAASNGHAGNGAAAAAGAPDAGSRSGGARAVTAGSGTARARARGTADDGNGAGRTPPPLDLPSRQADNGPPAPAGWGSGAGSARPRWPGTATRPSPGSAPPRAPASHAPSAPAPPPTGNGAARGNSSASGAASLFAARGGHGAFTRSPAALPGPAGEHQRPAREQATGSRPAAPATGGEPVRAEPPSPFWLRPVRRRK
jgi:TrbL/VirB6 plasmid conjugal transfer protein